MNKSPFILLLAILLSSSVNCLSQKVTISGYVKDSLSGERLPAANIFIGNGARGTTANAYGFYSITLNSSQDSVVLRFSYQGYVSLVRNLHLHSNQTIDILLNRDVLTDSVVVTSSKKKELVYQSLMSSHSMGRDFINALPAVMGEADVLRSIQLLPGVQSGAEGTGGFYVRGGSIDQNLILLDGVPVYNASHLFGFFSVFNTDAIQNVELMKGGFPARYGGRLSSVVDIRMKEGNNQKIEGTASLGTLAAKVTIEGPIKKNKSSFIVSARRTYADLLAKPFVEAVLGDSKDASYYFYDLNAKFNATISEKDHLYVSTYLGKDKLKSGNIYEDLSNGSATPSNKNQYNADFYWGNATAVTRWNHQFNKKLFSNFTAYITQYDFNLYNEKSYPDTLGNYKKYAQKYLSSIFDKSVRADIDFIPTPNHFIKTGASVTWHDFKPTAFQYQVGTKDSVNDAGNINATESDVYVEDDWRISRIVKMNVGAHFSMFNVGGTTYQSLQPRVSARFLLNSQMSIKASYIQMTQYMHLLTNSGVGLPTDLWVPATATVKPQNSTQYALGWNYQPNTVFEFSTEAYYKSIHDVIEYAEGASFLTSFKDWQQKVVAGNGESYGVEFLAQKRKGRTTGLIGYTWSKSNRTFPDLNNGNVFPYKYDRRNDIKLAIVHQFSKNIQASMDWVYGTGLATTLPTAVYLDNNNKEIEVYSSRNNYRLPAYHRLDLGVQFKKQKKHYERTWSINVYNAYSRLNTFYIYRDTVYDPVTRQYKSSFYSVALFPIIPSISYSVKF